MRVSWNWLCELIDLTSETPEGLEKLLTQRGLEVEEVKRLGEGLEKVVCVEILEKKPHPQADRLSLCLVESAPGVTHHIVCGAQNMKVGDKVALAQIGAHLPCGLKITESKIRGEKSQGMLCSEEELCLKEKSEGILILDPETRVGAPITEVLGLDEILFTLKLTANRADCQSHLGLARELASAKSQTVKPLKSTAFQSLPKRSARIEGDGAVKQFLGCWIENVQVGPSPKWLSERLERLGIRSINSVVDITNWVMLEMGHPLHAYDADFIQGSLVARLAKEEEELVLLDGEKITLTSDDIVIADEKEALGLGGVMGGRSSQITNQTKNIFLECAHFDARIIRRTAFRHQRRTEAAQRAEKGIDPSGLVAALGRACFLIQELAQGKTVAWCEEKSQEFLKGQLQASFVSFGVMELNELLGLEGEKSLTPGQTQACLESLGCQVQQKEGTQFQVTPPSYRLDLKIKEDFAEEIARSIGYDQIPSELPKLSSSPVAEVSRSFLLDLNSRLRRCLVEQGLQETLSFSFGRSSWLEKCGFSTAIPLLNPLSEEYAVLVPSLLPSLIEAFLSNWNHHFGSEALAVRQFQLRPIFTTESEGASEIRAIDDHTTPIRETWKLAVTLSGLRYAQEMSTSNPLVDFYDLKGILESIFSALGVRGLRLLPLKEDVLFHPGQSAEILAGDEKIGKMGLLHPKLAQEWKSRAPLWMMELDWEKLSQKAKTSPPQFKAWPSFPTMERDFALVVQKPVQCEKICQLALKAGKPLAKSVKVFDIYEGDQLGQGMTSVAVRVIFYEQDRSLTEAEAEMASTKIVDTWKSELQAQLRGN